MVDGSVHPEEKPNVQEARIPENSVSETGVPEHMKVVEKPSWSGYAKDLAKQHFNMGFIIAVFVLVVVIAWNVWRVGAKEAFVDLDKVVVEKFYSEMDRNMTYEAFIERYQHKFGVTPNSKDYYDFVARR